MSTDSSLTRLETREFERLERAANDEGFLVVPDDQDDSIVVDSNDFDIGHSIDGYELIRKVGSGGSSIVYLGRPDADPLSAVAVKIFNCSVHDTASLIRFNRETNALKRLDHPNVVNLIDFGITQDKHPYIIFDFIDGNRIDDFCSEHNLSISDRVGLMVSICFALQHAHDQGIIHRDLKPSNVIVDQNGMLFLTDFGLSKFFEDDSPDSEKTRTGAVLGTLNYLAPEQLFAMTNKLSTSTDVFGLGAILHVLLTGRPPLDFDNVVEAATSYFGKLPTKLDVNGVSADLEAICIKCLSANPKFRYATAEEVGADLKRFLDGKPVKAKRPSLTQQYSLFSKRYPYLAWAIPLVFAALLGFSSVVFGLWQKSENAFEEADASRFQLLQAMEALSDEIRTLENSPETLDARMGLLQIICDNYATQEKLFDNSPNALQQSAVADFKLGDLALGKSNTGLANNYLELARDKFARLMKLEPANAEAAFGLFQSLLWLKEYERALIEISLLAQDYPDNNDYRDALCTVHMMIGNLRLGRFDYANARAHFEAGRVAADSLPEKNVDGRFQRKRALVKIALARLAIVDGDLAAASKLIADCVEINGNLDPANLNTYGEAVELLTYLQFGFSIEAFRGNVESARELYVVASEFYEQAQLRFSSYVHIYSTRCRTIRDYVAFCHDRGMTEELHEAGQAWKTTLEDWRIIDTGRRLFYLERLKFYTCPFLPERELDKMVEARLDFLTRTDKSLQGVVDVGRSYVLAGELDQAQAFFAKETVNRPTDLVIRRYGQWLQSFELNDAYSDPEPVSEESRRLLLSTIMTYDATLMEATMKEDAKSFRDNFGGL